MAKNSYRLSWTQVLFKGKIIIFFPKKYKLSNCNCKNKLKNSVNKNSWEAARGLALILFYTLALISGPYSNLSKKFHITYNNNIEA